MNCSDKGDTPQYVGDTVQTFPSQVVANGPSGLQLMKITHVFLQERVAGHTWKLRGRSSLVYTTASYVTPLGIIKRRSGYHANSTRKYVLTTNDVKASRFDL